MSNANCLEDIRCPNCGQEDRFFIIGGAQFEVTDEGSETIGDHEWGDESPTRCPDCEHTGTLNDFRIQTELPPDPYCLHLWRPLDAVIPLPPSILVGPKPSGEAA